MGIESKSYRETEMLELLVRILHPNNPKTDELHSEYQPVAERLAEEEGDNYLDLRRQLERAARYPTARKDGLTILEQYGLLSNDNPRERSEGSYITRLITRVAGKGDYKTVVAKIVALPDHKYADVRETIRDATDGTNEWQEARTLLAEYGVELPERRLIVVENDRSFRELYSFINDGDALDQAIDECSSRNGENNPHKHNVNNTNRMLLRYTDPAIAAFRNAWQSNH